MLLATLCKELKKDAYNESTNHLRPNGWLPHFTDADLMRVFGSCKSSNDKSIALSFALSLDTAQRATTMMESLSRGEPINSKGTISCSNRSTKDQTSARSEFPLSRATWAFWTEPTDPFQIIYLSARPCFAGRMSSNA